MSVEQFIRKYNYTSKVTVVFRMQGGVLLIGPEMRLIVSAHVLNVRFSRQSRKVVKVRDDRGSTAL